MGRLTNFASNFITPTITCFPLLDQHCSTGRVQAYFYIFHPLVCRSMAVTWLLLGLVFHSYTPFHSYILYFMIRDGNTHSRSTSIHPIFLNISYHILCIDISKSFLFTPCLLLSCSLSLSFCSLYFWFIFSLLFSFPSTPRHSPPFCLSFYFPFSVSVALLFFLHTFSFISFTLSFPLGIGECTVKPKRRTQILNSRYSEPMHTTNQLTVHGLSYSVFS